MPSTATVVPFVDLYNTSSIGDANYVMTLAQDVPPLDGQATFLVPSVQPGSYFVMGMRSLFVPPVLLQLTRAGFKVGAYGQSSAHFEIEAAPYVPNIITPNESTVWTIGEVATITWCVVPTVYHPTQCTI